MPQVPVCASSPSQGRFLACYGRLILRHGLDEGAIRIKFAGAFADLNRALPMSLTDRLGALTEKLVMGAYIAMDDYIGRPRSAKPLDDSFCGHGCDV